jgi:hypothetical protein
MHVQVDLSTVGPTGGRSTFVVPGAVQSNLRVVLVGQLLFRLSDTFQTERASGRQSGCRNPTIRAECRSGHLPSCLFLELPNDRVREYSDHAAYRHVATAILVCCILVD